MSFRIGTKSHGERTVYSLHDDASGASASILPSFGFNLFDLRLPLAGQVRPVLVSAPDFADHPGHAAGNGTPILFPFPNRIRAGRFTFEGKTYQLPATNGPNAIHGFAMAAPWDVLEHKATDQAAYIVGRYLISKHSPESRTLAHRRVAPGHVQPRRQPALDDRDGFQSDRRQPTVWLRASSLFPSAVPPRRRSGDTQIILPASSYWVLEDFLPTGEIRPVNARLDFRQGQPRTGLKLDDVLTGLQYHEKRGQARLIDTEKKAEFRLTFDDGIRELVVYTPPQKPDVFAVEPYTQATDAINLNAKGKDAGLRILAHDRQDTFNLTMETLG